MKRKGGIADTVAKWLLVLVLLGILAVVMLSSGPPTAAAEASNLISNLRNCRMAALAYLKDRTASPELFPSPIPGANNIELINNDRYMDNPAEIIPEYYMFYADGDVWWVGFQIRNESVLTKQARDSVESRARSAGLYGTSDPTVPPVSDDLAGVYRKKAAAVWMRVK